MRLRQVVFVAADIATAEKNLCEVFSLPRGYNDPGVSEFGGHNTVLPIGHTFLEVISPNTEGAAARRYLKRRDDSGYMVIIQVDDMGAARRQVAELGIRTVWQADHEDIRGTHLHPRDVPGAILSLDEATPPESWRWAGPDWLSCVSTLVVQETTAVEIQAEDPLPIAERWAEVLDRPAGQASPASWVIPLDRGAVRFIDARDGQGDGVSGSDVAVSDRSALERAPEERDLLLEGDILHLYGVRVVPKESA